MPNPDISGNPWIFNPDDQGFITEQQVFVKHFTFTNYDDPLHRCIVKDMYGRVIFDQRGSAHMDPITIDVCQSVFGLEVVDLPSGQLQVHIY